MASWAELEAELNAWSETDRCATFWWRDDDATAMTPTLERLCAIAEAYDVRLSLAVIPADADTTILDRTDWPSGMALLQHGYAHRNHAPVEEKKMEFGNHRALAVIRDELVAGWSIIRRALPAVSAFVPPWNRISAEVVELLPGIGLTGLSTHGPRAVRSPAPGLVQSNTHVDPIDWHAGRGYVGDDVAIGQVVGHLRARRENQVDGSEPTGILTHHLAHDDDCWHFVERLAALLAGHAGACWLGAEEVFAA